MTPEELGQAIEEFKKIYQEEFGNKLNDKEAVTKVKEMLQLFNCLIERGGIQ